VASKKRLVLQVLAYTLYGFVVFVVLLCVTFPYDVLRQYMVERLSQEDLQLAIGRLRPEFPPGVQLQQLRLLAHQAELPGPLVHITTLRAHPELLPLFSGLLDVRLDSLLYSGRLQGNVRAPITNAAASWQLQVRFSDLQVEQYPLVQKDGKAFLRGQLGGELSATMNSNGLLQQGTLKLQLKPLVFAGNQGLQLPLQQEITCDTVQSELQMSPGQLQIVSFSCRGNDLSVEASGTVRWQRPVANSIVDLRLQLRSATTYKQELDLIGTLLRRRLDRRGVLSFSIRGPLQQPRFG
jgi:type II secretion system protein N